MHTSLSFQLLHHPTHCSKLFSLSCSSPKVFPAVVSRQQVECVSTDIWAWLKSHTAAMERKWKWTEMFIHWNKFACNMSVFLFVFFFLAWNPTRDVENIPTISLEKWLWRQQEKNPVCLLRVNNYISPRSISSLKSLHLCGNKCNGARPLPLREVGWELDLDFTSTVNVTSWF